MVRANGAHGGSPGDVAFWLLNEERFAGPLISSWDRQSRGMLGLDEVSHFDTVPFMPCTLQS
jgi:hypothetical protein